jgi:hypothetical protein
MVFRTRTLKARERERERERRNIWQRKLNESRKGREDSSSGPGHPKGLEKSLGFGGNSCLHM